jgi:predicted ATP-dependent serine protease
MVHNYQFKEPIYKSGEITGYNDIPADDKVYSQRMVTGGKPSFPRFLTGYKEVDDVLGGFPFGLTVFNGTSGSGKSKMCRTIAEVTNCLYVCAESLMDAPDIGQERILDYVKFQPKSGKAIRQLFGCIKSLESKSIDVDIVFIDSLTLFLSGTAAAVMEADIREGCFSLNAICERQLPVVGISEMRGSGNNMYSAGGKAVDFASSLLVTFDKVKVNNWNKKRYKRKEGELLYTLEVAKDRQGVAAQQTEYEITYGDDGTPHLTKAIEVD